MLYTNLYAQTGTLSVVDTSGVPGSANNLLNVELDNTVGVAGVQFTLTFDGNLLATTSANTTARTSHMNFGYSSWADSIKVLMYSIAGDSISPGTGPIVEILFNIDSSAVAGDSALLHLKDAILSDPHAQPISVNTVDGWFHFTTPVGVEDNQVSGKIPHSFAFLGNSPNPFVLTTNIRYQLATESEVSLKIYSCTGRLIRTLIDGRQKASYYTISWDGCGENGKKVATGIYFCKIETYAGPGVSGYTAISKIIFLR